MPLNKMTSTTTTTMPAPSQTTLHFKKTLREVREIEIDYKMDYDEFIANNMDKLDDENDGEFAARCLAVWEALCDKQEKKTKHTPAYVCLGEDEHEDCWEDWDGDAEENCADDITEMVESKNKEFPKWAAWKAMADKRRKEEAAAAAAAWKAQQEQMKKEQAERVALLTMQEVERKAEYARWVWQEQMRAATASLKEHEEKAAALRAELKALEENV